MLPLRYIVARSIQREWEDHSRQLARVGPVRRRVRRRSPRSLWRPKADARRPHVGLSAASG
jgi:hypothetical protein